MPFAIQETMISELAGDDSWDRHNDNAKHRANDSVYRDRLETGASDDLLDIFLNIDIFSPKRNYMAKAFRANCPNDILQELHDGRHPASEAPEVWLDDRSRDMKPRSRNGTLPVADFHRVLQYKRFGEIGEPEAAIRKIHIPTPNPPAVAALVLASTPMLAPVLNEFLWRHFNTEKAIKIRLPPDAPTFAMQFHMSFPVWRTDNIPGMDFGDVSNLKRVLDIRHLTRKGNPEHGRGRTDILHVAQASVVVAGYTPSLWDAISLVDKSLEPESPENEKSLRYYDKQPLSWFDDDSINSNMEELTLTSGKMDEIWGVDSYDDSAFDPLTCGKNLADTRYPDPRDYFLLVLRHRAEQARGEWFSTIRNLQDRIEAYTQSRQNSLHQTKSIEESEKWLTKTTALLEKLTNLCANNINSWTSFESRDRECFLSGSMGSQEGQLHSLFREISDIFEELGKDLLDLKDLQNKCKDFQHQITRAVMVKENRVLSLQHRIFSLQHWTVTLLHYTIPPTLACGIMQSGSINFNPPILCFIVLTAFFGIIVLLVAPGSPLSLRLKKAAPDMEKGLTVAGVPDSQTTSEP